MDGMTITLAVPPGDDGEALRAEAVRLLTAFHLKGTGAPVCRTEDIAPYAVDRGELLVLQAYRERVRESAPVVHDAAVAYVADLHQVPDAAVEGGGEDLRGEMAAARAERDDYAAQVGQQADEIAGLREELATLRRARATERAGGAPPYPETAVEEARRVLGAISGETLVEAAKRAMAARVAPLGADLAPEALTGAELAKALDDAREVLANECRGGDRVKLLEAEQQRRTDEGVRYCFGKSWVTGTYDPYDPDGGA